MRVFSAPRWSMPIALAATLVLAFAVIFRAGMPQEKAPPKPEVTVQNISDRVEKATAPAVAGENPAWRRDPKAWQAEIQRLRDAGDAARADAEYAEFMRQQRAFASSPDR
jgi:hypothetical protein